jgi:RNA polymerase sigma-70 factor (ECF subfamily)
MALSQRGQPMTEPQPFESFVRNYQNMVFSTAMRLLADQSEAEDIAQEVFLKAYERFGELRDSPTAGGWLKRVATNLSLNHLSRYRSRWRFFSELAGGRDEEDEHPVEFAAPGDLAEELARADAHELVEQALQALPTAQRVPLLLYHLEGLRYEEIAARLKVSLAKVKTDIFRGREALRKKLRLALADTEAGGAGGTFPSHEH